MKWTKPFSFVFILLGLVLFFKFLIGLWGYTVDDAFISFRYAENIVNGKGIVWNSMGPSSEGYTSFLWLVLLVLGELLGFNLLLYSKILGLVFLLGVIYLFWKFSQNLFKKDLRVFVFSLALFLTLSNSFTALHAVAGLETMMFTFSLVTLLWYAYKKDLRGLSYAALFSSLTRPEGIIASFVIFILAFGNSKNKRGVFRFFGFGFAFPLLIYFIIRSWYFGLLFPLPVIVKVLNNSFTQSGPFIFLNFLIYVLPFLLVIYLNKFVSKFRLRLMLLGPLSYLLFYPFSNHWMNYGMRLYFPSYILIYLLTSISIGYFLHKNTKYVILVGLVMILLPFSNFDSFKTFKTYSKDMPHYPKTALHQIGKALSEFYDDELLLVTGYGGAIPYFSKLRHVDTYGLTDPNIAVSGIASLEYIEKLSPDIILAYNSVDEVPKPDTHFLPFEGPFIKYAIENNYIVLPGILFISDYYFIPLVNPHLNNFEAIKGSLAAASNP